VNAVVGPDDLRHLVEELAVPRSSLHEPGAAAATEEALAEEFGSAGWEVERQAFHRRVALGVRGRRFGVPWLYHSLHGVNVVARQEGQDAAQVVVVAHRDTVRGSPGADDNASGLAVLVALARTLGPLSSRLSLVLAATDMEEMWALGAPPLVRDLLQRGPVEAAIVVDAIGFTSGPGTQRYPPGFRLAFRRQAGALRARGRRGDFAAVIHGRDAAGLASAVVDGIAASAGGPGAVALPVPTWVARLGGRSRGLAPVISTLCRSDNRAFWAAGIPTVLVTGSGNYRNPHYHRASGEPDTLDYDHLAAVVAGCLRAVSSAAGVGSEPVAAADQSCSGEAV